MISKLLNRNVKRNGGAVAVGPVLVLLLLVVVVGYFVMNGGDQSEQVAADTPQGVLAQALANAAEVETSESSGYIEVHIVPAGLEEQGLPPGFGAFHGRATFTAKGDINDLENTKAEINLIFEQASPNDETFERPIKQLDLDLVTEGQISYIRANKLPDMLAMFMPMMLDYQGQWFKVDPEDIAKTMGTAEDIEAFEEMNELSSDPEMIMRLVKMVSESNYVDVVEELPNEDLAGQEMFHYKVALNQDGLEDLVLNLFDFMVDEGLLPEDQFGDGTGYEPSLDEIKAEVENFFAELPFDLSVITGEVWIGTDDILTHKMRLNIPVEVVTEGEMTGTVVIESTNSNFGKPVTINIPSGATSIVELIETIEGMFAPVGFEEMPVIQ